MGDGLRAVLRLKPRIGWIDRRRRRVRSRRSRRRQRHLSPALLTRTLARIDSG